MAVSRKVEREILRTEYLEKIIDFFKVDEEVLRVKSNEIAIPVVGCESNEDFIVVTVKVPTGANKGTEPYDGYSEAESYEMKLKEKAKKAKKNAEKKAKKITFEKGVDKCQFLCYTIIRKGKEQKQMLLTIILIIVIGIIDIIFAYNAIVIYKDLKEEEKEN